MYIVLYDPTKQGVGGGWMEVRKSHSKFCLIASSDSKRKCNILHFGLDYAWAIYLFRPATGLFLCIKLFTHKVKLPSQWFMIEGIVANTCQ